MARNAKTVLIVDSIENEDKLLVQDGNYLYRAEAEELFNSIHLTPRFGELPEIYSISSKGGVVATRGEVFSTIYNLLLASYGEVTLDTTIYLNILDTTNRLMYSGNWYFNVDHMKCEENSQTFITGDTSTFNGLVISPYGEIIGTESW